MKKSLKLLLILVISFCIKKGCLIGNPSTSDTTSIKVNRMPGPLPRLGFACELDPIPLQALLNTQGVISDLRELKAYISLALRDLSKDRALAVQQLNNEGIPVVAWLALPKDQGYYMNDSNSSQAIVRFAEFESWTAKYNLKWIGVGIDIEPNFAEFGKIEKSSRWNLVTTILGRSLSIDRLHQSQDARKIYSDFIKLIEDHGYPVQTYQLAFVADERKVHSTLLDRIVGVVPVHGKTEAMMLYTSFTHNFGSALVWSYGPESRAIVIGVTGGGADSASSAGNVPLNWKELSNDLIVASHFTNDIGIFSLEGCVQQGFLSNLKNLDWDQTIVLSGESLKKVAHFRTGIQAAIWIVTNLSYFVAAILLLIIWLFWHKHKKKIKTESVY
jgi:hypothetical protein